MPNFIFTGDVKHPGRIIVEAGTREEAIKKFEEYDFAVYDEAHKNLAFDWNGEDPEVESPA